MKITLCQISIQAGEIERNLERAFQALEEAARQGGELALLPELWPGGYDLPNALKLAGATPAIVLSLQEFSREHNLLIGGSLLQQDAGNLYNAFILVDPGHPPIVYRKVHLFKLMDEHRWLSPGDRLITADIGPMKAGLGICYDLRFPELFRTYALDGVNLFLLSAEWPARRIEHWNMLTRARAIENQSFLAAVNTVGVSGSATYGGCSAVISPWGETLIQASSIREDVLTCEIDPSQIASVRSHLPIFSDRRPEVYKEPPANFPETT